MQANHPTTGRDWLLEPWRPILHRVADKISLLGRIRAARRLRQRMLASLEYEPDLRHPGTFNERIAWKILHDRNPLIPLTLDKVAVRSWVAERIGEHFLVPLLGVWHSAGDIPWDELPARFVAKTNHGSGYNILVADKGEACRAEVLRQLDHWLAESYFDRTGEWGYRDIPRRILIEEFLEGSSGRVPEDYKLYVFGGQPKLLEVHLGRFTSARRQFFYDPRTLQPVDLGRFRHADHPDYAGPPKEARVLHDLAARLGAEFDAVRVDFYLVDRQPRFSEMTHYSGGGSVSYGSREHDRILGELWGDALRQRHSSIPRGNTWLERLRHSRLT